MSRVFKILVTGPAGSGKTTFISAISEIEVVSTERAAGETEKKGSTTVAMDFGRVTLTDGDVLHLYGTPGQDRFDFMWEILSEGMLGYVVLLDGTKPPTFATGKKIMESFSGWSDAPYVVGLTRADRKKCLEEEKVPEEIASWGEVDIVRCDARSLRDVKTVLITLLERVLENAEGVEQAG
ncbi:MAG: ATP/GTP-binding protein [Actinobacteria bacterium]|nr:ATP/GTP-binding protein [Actinomycetota bacterium]MBU4489266.1 ATP/GTP-binding protein [Actinomycetota bacterium]